MVERVSRTNADKFPRDPWDTRENDQGDENAKTYFRRRVFPDKAILS